MKDIVSIFTVEKEITGWSCDFRESAMPQDVTLKPNTILYRNEDTDFDQSSMTFRIAGMDKEVILNRKGGIMTLPEHLLDWVPLEDLQ